MQSVFRHLRTQLQWPEVVAAVAPLLVFWRLVLGGQVLYWGLPALQFVPWRALMNEALRQGHWPLWTPLLGLGAPLMANYQSAVFYPPNWLALGLPPEVAVSLLAVLHLSVAGVGMVKLARRLGLGDFGAAVAGLTFGLAGYLTGRLWFITINNAIVWLPWIVLASTPAAPPAGRGVKQFLILAALLAVQLLAGHAQSTFYTWLIVGAWIIWRSLFPSMQESLGASQSRNDQSLKISETTRNRLNLNLQPLISHLSFFGLALVLAVGLTAVQLIPTFELLRQSPRAVAADYDFVMTYSLSPWRVLTFLAPNLFGHPADHNYFGYASYWEDNGYMGILPVAFALYALYRLGRTWWRDRHAVTQSVDLRLGLFCLLLIFVSILLALGQNTPIFPFFYRYVPGFSLFQAPARMLIGYTFAFSLLAGMGAQEWQASVRKRYWSRLGIAGSLGTLALGVAGAYTLTNPHAQTLGSGLAWMAVFALGAFGLLLNQPAAPRRWHWAVIIFITLDLGLAAVRLNPTTDRTLYQLRPMALPQSRTYQFAADEYRVKFNDFFRFKSFDRLDPQALRNSFLANLNVLDGVASANNFDPLLPARYVTYLKEMEQHPRLLALADVRTIIKPLGILSPIAGSGAARDRLVTHARTVANAEAALAAITDPNFDPDTEVILEPAPPVEWHGWALDPNRVVIPYSGPAGYVMLADTFYPGWRVFVDGVEQPVLHANYLFKAVAVSAGAHEVVFEYAPFSVTLGLIVSLLALSGWVGAWLVQRR